MKKIYITPALTDANIETKFSALQVTASDLENPPGYGGEDPGVEPESKRRGFGHSILDDNTNTSSNKDLW